MKKYLSSSVVLSLFFGSNIDEHSVFFAQIIAKIDVFMFNMILDLLISTNEAAHNSFEVVFEDSASLLFNINVPIWTPEVM